MAPPATGPSNPPPRQAATFKVVLLGEGRVGKTSLVLRYVHGIFSPDQPATVQAAFLMKQLRLSDGSEAVLSIWDTAGQERFHALGPIYYRDADGALLVYDVTVAESLERVKKWVAEVRLMGPPGISLVIAANKMDLLPLAHPESSGDAGEAPLVAEGNRYAQEVGAAFVQTSAKDGTGVAEAFMTVASEVARHFMLKPEAQPFVNAPLVNQRPLVIVDDSQAHTHSATSSSSCCT